MGSGPDAFEAALGALGHKERTSAELVAWLERRGFDFQDIEAAISRLIEAGEVDDGRFARRYAEDKRELRGWGPDRIRDALSGRGLGQALIDAALAEDTREAQVERATQLIARRRDDLTTDAGRTRALGHLTRRGYDYEIAYEAIRSYDRAA
jgi:regulatory protein